MPAATKLAQGVTEAQQSSVNSLIEQVVPGFSRMQERLMGLAEEAATNPYDLPADVEANIARKAAERGVSVGGRGQFQEFSALRDLGINSLQYGQSRISQAGNLFSLIRSLAPVVNPTSPLAFLVPTGTAIQTDILNKGNYQASAQGGANVDAQVRNEQLTGLGETFGAFAGLLQHLPVSGANDPSKTGVEATTARTTNKSTTAGTLPYYGPA